MVTPFRQTDIILDADNWVQVEPTFSFCRFASKMFKKSSKDSKAVVYNNGLIVKPYVLERNLLVEDTVQDALRISLTVSSLYGEEYHWAKSSSSEMPGVTYGANIVSQGHKLWTKKVSASANWGDGVLTGDATMYPSPTNSDDSDIWAGYTFDRVAYSGNLNVGDDITIEIIFEQAREDEPGPASIFQFVGPPSNGDSDGYLYALVINICGRLTLLCKINNVWTRVAKCSLELSGHIHWLLYISKSEIGIEEYSGNGGYIGISAFALSSGGGGANGLAYAALNVMQIAKTNAPEFGTIGMLNYKVPCSKIRKNTLPSLAGPLHIDIRRDLMAHFQVFKSGYPTDEITVVDDPFNTTIGYRDVSGINDFIVTYQYRKPTGCSIDLLLRDSITQTELTCLSTEETLVSGDFYFARKVYQLPDFPVLEVAVKLKATSDFTPKLYYYNVQKNGIIKKVSGLEKTLHQGTYKRAFGTKVGITGPTRALDYEKATINVSDLNDCLSVLATRASMPIRIETTYDGINKCILFRGYVQKAVRHIKSAPINNGFVQNAFSTYELMCNGPWQLLKENFHEGQAEVLYEVNPEEMDDLGKGRKVTEIISSFLTKAGFVREGGTITADEAMQDIPDVDIRIFGFGKNQLYVVNPLDDIQKVIESMLRDYLGGYLIWDNNLGLNGKWVYKDPPQATDIPKAVFYTSLPSHLSNKKIDYLPSWDSSPVVVSGTTYYIPGSFIVKDTWDSWVKPPEANDIIVTGIGAITEKGGDSYTTARLFNKDSFDVDPVNPTSDPTNPDYLGRRVPLWVVDYGIAVGTNDDEHKLKVSLICRRIYDMVAHGIKKATFKAPLLFIPHEDDATRMRPLRYYDLIYIDNTPWLIRSVNIQYTKDKLQFAMYEVEAPRFVAGE